MKDAPNLAIKIYRNHDGNSIACTNLVNFRYRIIDNDHRLTYQSQGKYEKNRKH